MLSTKFLTILFTLTIVSVMARPVEFVRTQGVTGPEMNGNPPNGAPMNTHEEHTESG